MLLALDDGVSLSIVRLLIEYLFLMTTFEEIRRMLQADSVVMTRRISNGLFRKPAREIAL